MADKKYYWLKLKDDFFRDKEIKKLRKIAGGDTYTIIYLKLQLLSLKNEGKLVFENLEDTFYEEMALEIDEETDNVKITIAYLQRCNLIEEVNQNEFILPQTMKSIGTETQGAERVRRHRAKEIALHGNTSVTNCNTEIEKEKELERRDREKREEKELELDKISWKEILVVWNDLPSPIKPIKGITDNRRNKIRARVNSLKVTVIEIIQAINNIRTSDFLLGKNGKGWQIDFDWLFSDDTRFSKVLEGKYLNTEKAEAYNKNVQAGLDLVKKYENEGDKGESVW